MKWIVGVSIFFATALGWVATTTIPAATITPDEATLKYFPAETESIAFVDVAALRDVPLVHDALYQGQLKSMTPEIGGFIDSTGFDVRRDLDSVMIGRSGRDHRVADRAKRPKGSRHVPTLRDQEGRDHRLWGLIPARTVMHARFEALGYVTVHGARDCLLGPAGTRVRGHEFHYSSLEALAPIPYATELERPDRPARPDGIQVGGLLAGYAHMHFGSNPQVAGNLLARSKGLDAH